MEVVSPAVLEDKPEDLVSEDNPEDLVSEDNKVLMDREDLEDSKALTGQEVSVRDLSVPDLDLDL